MYKRQLLLLDEPTNDLDVNTLRALEEALENFGGCAVIISCLLYTSDAADERSSVDLGGRRIIKKKNKDNTCEYRYTQKKR